MSLSDLRKQRRRAAKSVLLEECRAKGSNKSAPQECPRRAMSLESVFEEYQPLNRECQKPFGRLCLRTACVHSGL